MKLIYALILCFLLFTNCKSVRESRVPYSNESTNKQSNQSELKNWFQKDYLTDRFPGISLDKWESENKMKPKVKNIIVGIIDTQVDLKHEDLQGQIWVNAHEIPNNNIDDDHNGYIDDVNGWSFIGTKKGSYLTWSNFESIRIIREGESKFKNKAENEISAEDLREFKGYNKALKEFEKNDKYYRSWLKSLTFNAAVFPLSKDTLKYFFPKENYTYTQLDSLYKKHKTNDRTYRQRRDDNDRDLGALISYMMVSFEVNQKTLEEVKTQEKYLDSIVNKNLSFNYNERVHIGDNPKILEKGYGNNQVSLDKELQSHNTKVSGIIAANRENKKGIKGFSQNIKVMPLNLSCSGDEHDKDIAMAIRYAVDNGAKVINMSFGKELSLRKEWVFDAFKYAEEHNVLIIHSAGNSALNVDENQIYPSDIDLESPNEVCGNFINVGSTTHHLDSTFVSNFSNYGKKNVDLFAPGDEIYTTKVGNEYEFDSGTSLAAPMVSGTASLIWLYYPKLTVKEVKQIILDSGTSYDLEVILPGTKDKKVPFSQLSKSGKVLNVYNAMKMAEKIHKTKQ
ncbi:S8 family peptidase [Flavobacterium sp.]|uniref:S8 family peptidase n=1 Tax=Flavobacterium sp. TaxID=239 RepID=UPI002637C33E|nr:S8 family peptidase [Flavobacterium sp.]